MNSIRREHWDQARAFADWIGKQDEDTNTAALLKPHFNAWARSKDFASDDMKVIWKLVLLRRVERKKKRIKPYNKERLERVRGNHTYGPYHHWMSRLQCILAVFPDHQCMRYADRGWVKGHHIHSVGAGGRDWENEVPTCMLAHSLCETHWSQIEETYGINLLEIARSLADECPKEVWEAMQK